MKYCEIKYNGQDVKETELSGAKRFVLFETMKSVLPLGIVGLIMIVIGIKGYDSENELLFLVLSAALGLVFWGIAFILFMRAKKKYKIVKTDILSNHEPFEAGNKNERDLYERFEDLPYQCGDVYNACIKTILTNYKKGCYAIPFEQIDAGWLCSANNNFCGKMRISLLPIASGTRITLSYATIKDKSKGRFDLQAHASRFINLVKRENQAMNTISY